MAKFVLARLGQGIIALALLVSFVFVVMRTTGDPTHMMLGAGASREQRDELRAALGLDKPLIVQYGKYWARVLRLDFGKSLNIRKPALEIIGERLPNSAKLATASMLIALLLGMPLGIIGAVKRDTVFDTFAKMIAVLGQSLPTFWVGLVLMEIFAVHFKILPVAGMGGLSNYILPAITMGWYVVAGIMRLLRSNMLDVLDSEYIKMARAKGMPESRVILKHALMNAIIPLVSFIGVYFAILLTATIIVETVFAWPGFGLMMYNALLFRDFPLIEAAVIISGMAIITINLSVDILYTIIDPRIRFQPNR